MNILIAIIYVFALCWVAKMATQQDRSIFLWVFLSFFVTPFGTLLLLFLLKNRKKTVVTRHDIDPSISLVDQRPTQGILEVNCLACRIPIRNYKLHCDHCGTEQQTYSENPHLLKLIA